MVFSQEWLVTTNSFPYAYYKTINMSRVLALFSILLLSVIMVYGQTKTVSGTVRNDRGDPVPFATITESGTKNAVQADANGAFTIKVASNARLAISASGHETQVVSSSGDLTAIRLSASNGALTEVVVTTALGIRRQSKELGYAATSIGNKLLTQGKA